MKSSHPGRQTVTARPFLLIILAFLLGAYAEFTHTPVRPTAPCLAVEQYHRKRSPTIEPDSRHIRSELVSSNNHIYSIQMGGRIDAENTLTRVYNDRRISFQPNTSLTIENVGPSTVINPRITVNGKRNWHSLDSVVDEFTRKASSEQEKAFLIWENMRKNAYHWWPAVGGHDPIQLLNTYGFALCDQRANAAVSMFLEAGLVGSRVLGLGGHVVSEAMVEGRHQLLDADMGVFFLDRQNEIPASANDCWRDPDLVRREFNHPPSVSLYKGGKFTAALYGPDDGPWPLRKERREIELSLRPGEKIVYRWDNIGKTAPMHHSFEDATPPPLWANSVIVYRPRLDRISLYGGASSMDRILEGHEDGGSTAMVSGPKMGSLVYEVAVPYAITGGKVTALFSSPGSQGRFIIEIAPDRGEWSEVSRGRFAGIASITRKLDGNLRICESDPLYRYLLKISFGKIESSRQAHLKSIEIETDFMVAPSSLPALTLGKNKISYTDLTEGDREIIITHEWSENTSHVPPSPPDGVVFPENGEEVQSSTVPFSWPQVSGADLYHLMVSRRPDMAFPFRPSLDVIIPENAYSLPLTGAFSPGEVYFYRLRSRDAFGAWGPWSKRRSFTWKGPGIPRDVSLRFEGHVGTLRWAPGDRGSRPVSYAVFGYDEKGFSLPPETHATGGGEDRWGGLAGETSGTEMVVVSGETEGKGLNRTFYRVVAIDKTGTKSGPSDFVEAPHPFIFSIPATSARIGETYSYRVRSLLSHGSLQRLPWGTDLPADQFAYVHEERQSFELLEGPSWLTIDTGTGVLEGVVADDGRSEWLVTVGVRDQFQGYDEQSFRLQLVQ